MASGQSPLEPERTGSSTGVNQSPAQAEQGKSQAVRTAMWGLGVAILSNIANIFKQLRDVIESLVQLKQFTVEHPWVSAVVIGVVIAWGNVMLFRFLYQRLKRRIPTAYKVLAPGISLAIVTVVIVTNWFSLQSLLQNPVQVKSELASELAATQDIDGGAFRNATTPQGIQDPWTTAQSVKALLTAGGYDPGRIKKAFSYIESRRKDDGFDVVVGQDTKPFVRTEIAAWVAVAYLEALPRPDLWTDSERTAAIDGVESTLRLIVAQQDRSSGGWSPVPAYAAAHQRAYATMMAVWALTEGLLSPEVSKKTKERLGASFETGVSWLINHYVSKLGWEENPSYPLGKVFPGLTYQILFVLERAQLVTEHNSFKNTEAYRRVKRELKNTLHSVQVGDLASVPTAYIMVGEYSCWADVLAYPWLLSILPILIADPDVPSNDRGFLKGLLRDEVNKVDELPHFLEHAETWQVAESVFGVSNLINSQKVRH